MRDERGLVGKLLVITLLGTALVAILLLDAGSIVLARVRTADLAQDASFAAAEAFAESGDREAAESAARAAIEDAGARLKRLDVLPSGEVKVVLTDRAGTLLVGRIWFLEDLVRVTVTDTGSASGS